MRNFSERKKVVAKIYKMLDHGSATQNVAMWNTEKKVIVHQV